MPYAENIDLRDCSRFLQIGSHICILHLLCITEIATYAVHSLAHYSYACGIDTL